MPNVPSHRRALVVASLLLSSAIVAACGDSTGSGDDPRLNRAPAQPDSQLVDPSTEVAVAPAVYVTDAKGEPLAGVRVTFTPGTNSGSVTDGSPVTGVDGIATVGSWRVGAGEGRQTLVARLAKGSGRVTFLAFATPGGSNPCAQNPAYVLGTTSTGTLARGDCAFSDGSYLDLWLVTPTAPVNHELRMSAPSFDAWLWVFDTTGAPWAADNDSYGTDPAIRLIAPAKPFLLGANSLEAAVTGAYTLTSSTGPVPAGCAFNVYVRPGATVAGSIAASDCGTQVSGAGSYEDQLGLVVSPGQVVTVTHASTSFDPYLRVYTISGQNLVPLAEDDNSGGGTTARVTFTGGSQTQLYIIAPTTRLANQVGDYTLSLTATPSLVAAPASQASQASPATAFSTLSFDAMRLRQQATVRAMHARGAMR